MSDPFEIQKQTFAHSQDMGAVVDNLEEKLASGLQFADMLGFTNQQTTQENQILLHSLLELLVSKGVIRLHELEERKKEVSAYFQRREEQSPKIHLVETPDKYAATDSVQIDCEHRIHLCKASCCKLWFALSVQDLDERIVKWNYAQPYAIAQNREGYCVHLDHSQGCQCNVYQNRPLVCRTYDCRQDKRIWLDFDNRIPNPEIARDRWPQAEVTPNESNEEILKAS